MGYCELLDIKKNYDLKVYIEDNNIGILWDLLNIDWNFFVITANGDTLASNLMKYKNIHNMWNILSPISLMFIEFFRTYWFSNYRRILGLYIPDPAKFQKYKLLEIKKHKKLKVKLDGYKKLDIEEKNYYNFLKMKGNIDIITYDQVDLEPGKGQQLFVFPDLWTMENVKESLKNHKTSLFLSGNDTVVKKTKAFLDIKNAKAKNLFCTHSQIFQDYKNLKKIYVFDPYKWYYKNHQNPRYRLPEVINQIAYFYGVKELYFVITKA